MERVIFIRHGQSEANAGLRTCDQAAIPVTELGLQQASQVAQEFTAAPDLVVTSGFIRTKQTAQALLDRYPNTATEEWDVHEFTYLDPRRCVGTTFDERRPMMEEYWQRADPEYCEEGAESFASFLARVEAMIARLAQRKENCIAVFSHQYVMTAALWLHSRGRGAIDRARMRDFHEYHQCAPIPNAGMVRGRDAGL